MSTANATCGCSKAGMIGNTSHAFHRRAVTRARIVRLVFALADAENACRSALAVRTARAQLAGRVGSNRVGAACHAHLVACYRVTGLRSVIRRATTRTRATLNTGETAWEMARRVAFEAGVTL